MARRWYRTSVMAVVLVLIPVLLSAQPVTRRIFVSAVNAAGAPVLDLTGAEFTLTENGSTRQVTRATLGDAPMRIVLLVDSSKPVGPMINSFRAALDEFIETLPPEHEIALISTGGQIRVRTPPTTDREKLKLEIGRLAAEGGANAFFDTLVESDKRFLKTAPGQWPVIVIVTTDNGEQRRELPLEEYNRFMNDFLSRGGSAHAVIVRGPQVGPVTDMAQNLVENTGGIYGAINTDHALPERMRNIADRLATDHERMADCYEVEFASDAKVQQPVVAISSTRPGVRLLMSVRRPF